MLGITVISLCLLLALAFAIGQIVHLRRRLSEEAVDLSAIEALSTVWSWEPAQARQRPSSSWTTKSWVSMGAWAR